MIQKVKFPHDYSGHSFNIRVYVSVLSSSFTQSPDCKFRNLVLLLPSNYKKISFLKEK